MVTCFTTRGVRSLQKKPSDPHSSKIFKISRVSSLLIATIVICTHGAQAWEISPTPIITVRFSNQVPIAGPDFATTDEDTPVSGNVLSNDHDPEGSPIHAIAESKSTPHGHVDLQQDGTFTYTPASNYFGQDTFKYGLCDNGSPNACCEGTVTITVVPIQDAPVAVPDFYSAIEDTPLNVAAADGVLKNDSDPDHDPITAVLASPPSHGSIDLHTDGSFQYNPNHDYAGTDTFTYYANDGNANSAETLVTITVSDVNDDPIAVDDEVTTDEDVAVNIPILANDIDVDDPLVLSMVTIVDLPTEGTLVVNTTSGKVIYTPDLNFFGHDSFTYKIKDVCGCFSNVATVSITVNPVNDAPVAVPDFATTPEDVPVLIDVLSNDTDVDSPLSGATLTLVSGPSHGTAVLQSPAEGFLYTPDPDYFGGDSFTYTVTDPGGAVSAPGLVTITVTPVNDPPVAVDDAATTLEDTAVDIPVLDNDYDVDDPIVISSLAITANTTHGTIIVNTSTGVVTYTPATGFEGDDNFKYTITDPHGLVSNEATVSITITHVNHPPVAVDDALVHETSLPVTIDVLANDYDPDNTNDELTIISVTTPTQGQATIVDGKIIYQPEGTVSGTVTFSYTISDPDGLTDDAVVTITYDYKQINVSQGFSPNGDGINETWYIEGIDKYLNNLVKVFDRWGILVYQKQHYENANSPWDGRANVGLQAGKLVDRGTYFYIIEPGDGLATLSGYVVIVR